MRCEEIRSRLQDYVLGETSEDERSAIEDHLSSCSECQQEVQFVKWIVVALESDGVKEPSLSFVRSVMKRLPERVPALSATLLFAPLCFALAGLFGFGFFFREQLAALTGSIEVTVMKALSDFDPEAFVSNSVVPKMELIYLGSLGFACLLVTATLIWFIRYYYGPVQYTKRERVRL